MASWLIGSALKRRLWRQVGFSALGFLCTLNSVSSAAERRPVTIELVLALDCSASVDIQEFRQQLRGLAQAFGDPDVTKAVANLAPLGVAVAMIQWGGEGDTHVTLPFTVLNSKTDAIAFGLRIGQSKRRIRASVTSITTAISDGQALIEANQFEGQRLVIDISGDGKDNSGLDLDAARQNAKAAGITINGLPIEADDTNITPYYRDQVVIGASSFVEPAKDFKDYARAIRAKLLRELAPLAS